ncbi:GTPase HflX [Sedimentisphaera salicampi]|uniref:GTPase HflX n=1 Tax=Sedimentisphaera salicampi TaxID=1941349 RepID=A0A1W6LMV4_9BACT|nr:GTPase HflX [Sedimentisphaera salicampi]ARN57081.1 GTP-binding protein HflX [Sedimentisphaera salicampi]OXU14920.1 GTP-binding protein HflX [Sedimentisphaera salicampi]
MDNIREQLKVQKQRAVLVGAIIRGNEKENDNLHELTSLTETAGAIIVDRLQQKINEINPSTYIGRGKAAYIGKRAKEANASLVIFDNDLSPGQIKDLENILETQVIDRSELILDIFATRARTKQARLQVELAQLEYTYPRLTRMWSHLDTVTGAASGGIGAVGGIGTRGTGEKQLEIDRRLVNKRISELKADLRKIEKRKDREIESRHEAFKICLVGYTNAGKSTFMNAVTDAGVVQENKLFATLDTRTRRWKLESGAEALLSDTVGFVRKLPHQLVESFKATLSEALSADLLLHVVDVSSESVFEQIESVNSVLEDIGCGGKDILVLLNKSEIPVSVSTLDTLKAAFPDAIAVSAKTGYNIDSAVREITRRINGSRRRVKVVYSVQEGKIQGFLKRYADIEKTDIEQMNMVQQVVIGSKNLDKLRSLQPESIEEIE